MKTEDESRGQQVEREEREELETAWLRGWTVGFNAPVDGEEDQRQEAADYAERVVGGSTRPDGFDPEPFPSDAENAP